MQELRRLAASFMERDFKDAQCGLLYAVVVLRENLERDQVANPECVSAAVSVGQ